MIQKPEINLQALATRHQEPCVSMYIPTGARSGEPLQGKIRLKNMLRRTEDRIKEMGFRNVGMMRDNMQRAYGFLDDSAFWMQGGRGLAVFIDPEHFEYHLVPSEFKEVLVVSDRYHLKPLISIISENVDFFILRPSQKNAKLYRGNSFSIEEVSGVEFPADMASALMEEYPGSLSMHSAPTPGYGGTGLIVHGRAGGMEGEKEKFLRYARILDACVKPVLGTGRVPLVLTGVRYKLDIYRQVKSYPNVAEKVIEGNTDTWTLRSLQEAAIEAVRPLMDANRADALRRYPEKKSVGLASSRLDEILPAAMNGRVDYLFVGVGVQSWGTYDWRNNQAFVHDREYAGDFDLLDLAATQTFMTGGSVYAVPPDRVPEANGSAPIAAAFRY